MVEITFILNGLSRAMLLFLIASGLSLIFGLMGIVNFAHGSLYALGAYLGVAVLGFYESFWVALIVAPILIGIIGAATEYSTLRPLYNRDPVYGMLLTFGLLIVIEEGIMLVWGPGPQSTVMPAFLQGPVEIWGSFFPLYRLFVIAFGVIVAIVMWLALQRTRIGMIVRAGNLDSQMVEAMGINVRRVYTGMFAVGVGLAAVGGVVAGPVYSVYPTMGVVILIEAFIVVVIGGLGSVRGSFVGALIVGLSQSLGATYFSQYLGLLLFGLMIVVLVVRPHGIFGQEGLLEG